MSHRPGTIRHRDPESGEWVVTSPHDAWFSSRTMVAEEVWDVELEAWVRIFDDDFYDDEGPDTNQGGR